GGGGTEAQVLGGEAGRLHSTLVVLLVEELQDGRGAGEGGHGDGQHRVALAFEGLEGDLAATGDVPQAGHGGRVLKAQGGGRCRFLKGQGRDFQQLTVPTVGAETLRGLALGVEAARDQYAFPGADRLCRELHEGAHGLGDGDRLGQRRGGLEQGQYS